MNIALHQLFNPPFVKHIAIARARARHVDVDLNGCMRWVFNYIESSEVPVYYQDLHEDSDYEYMTLKKSITALVNTRKIKVIKRKHDYTMYEINHDDDDQLGFDF